MNTILKLGIQTNPGLVDACSLWKAKQWAEKNHKSFTIKSLTHTDYRGNPTESETGYATIKVEYFETLKGEHRLWEISDQYPMSVDK